MPTIRVLRIKYNKGTRKIPETFPVIKEKKIDIKLLPSQIGLGGG